MQALSDRLEKNRQAWPPSLLRSMWQDLMDFESGRYRSAEHETRWLNLLGYVLRPGYGMSADDWRVAQTWRTVNGRLAFATPASRSESLILWRRLAGGFTAGQQLAVYQQVAGPLRGLLDPVRRAKVVHRSHRMSLRNCCVWSVHLSCCPRVRNRNSDTGCLSCKK